MMAQPPSQTVVFISYSRKDIAYREALLPALRAVRSVGPHLWYDEDKIDVGEKFHPEVQEALKAAKIGILLLSHHFFDSEYIRQHELPFLVQQAELRQMKLALLYLTAVADGALEIAIEVDGQPHVVNLKHYLALNGPDAPLELLSPGEQNRHYAELADWVRKQLDTPVTSYPTGTRYDLTIALQPRRRHWEHRFSLPHAADFAKPNLDCPQPQTLLGDAAVDVDGQDVFDLLFGRETLVYRQLMGAAFDMPEGRPDALSVASSPPHR